MKDKEKLIYGIHPVLEALKANQSIQSILLQKGKNTWAIEDIKSAAEDNNIKVQFLPAEGFKKYQQYNHQGAVAFPSPVTFLKIDELIEKSLSKKQISYLVLDGVTDVRNLGAIIRNAESLNFDAIILPENNSASINETVVKTSAGAIYNLPICKVKHLSDAMMYLSAENIECIAITEKANQSINQYQLPDKMAFIMGDEGKGISPKILSACHQQLKIDLKGNTTSLNVSVATGIVLYERNRQLE
ncbi:MAG: 23S rRNA (guanosine(2251)-2'-O)-methyltransferase RlmB [Psychroflexus sp.]|nr:23S rRNA (guanosine(2251)-2'-O)-methyltransferase RlmB [Psychroflexus sp.]